MRPAGLDCTVNNENKYYEALTKSPRHFTWQVTAVIFPPRRWMNVCMRRIQEGSDYKDSSITSGQSLYLVFTKYPQQWPIPIAIMRQAVSSLAILFTAGLSRTVDLNLSSFRDVSFTFIVTA